MMELSECVALLEDRLDESLKAHGDLLDSLCAECCKDSNAHEVVGEMCRLVHLSLDAHTRLRGLVKGGG